MNYERLLFRTYQVVVTVIVHKTQQFFLRVSKRLTVACIDFSFEKIFEETHCKQNTQGYTDINL